MDIESTLAMGRINISERPNTVIFFDHGPQSYIFELSGKKICRTYKDFHKWSHRPNSYMTLQKRKRTI